MKKVTKNKYFEYNKVNLKIAHNIGTQIFHVKIVSQIIFCLK